MRKNRKWIAMLTVAIVLLSGGMRLFAAEDGGLDDLSALEENPFIQDTEKSEDISGNEDIESRDEPTEESGPEDTVGQDSELWDVQAGESNDEPEQAPVLEEPGAEEEPGEYCFVIADPGQDNYRPWEDMTVEIGENYRFDFYLARYENGEYEIASTSDFGAGIDLFSMSQTPQFTVDWIAGEGLYLIILPEYARTYTISLTYTHPETGERIDEVLTLHIVKEKYYFVISEPGGEDYRPWDDSTIHVGDEARYALHLARLEKGVYHIATDVEWDILFQEDEHFTLDIEEDGYYINVCPTQPGTYSIKLSYTNPGTGLFITEVLYLHVVGKGLDGELFKVVSPGGKETYWRDGQVGEVIVHYDGIYDPQQTLSITCRDDFIFLDTEGVLEFVSSNGNETVYALARTSWEKPCIFLSGDTVMILYVQLPEAVHTRFVLYDEDLAENAPDMLPTLVDGMLEPGTEARIAVLMENGGTNVLLANPLEIVRFSPDATAYQEPGEHFFTLIPQEGNLTLGIQRGHSETVWVGTRKPIKIYMTKKGTQTYGLLDGDQVRSRVKIHVVSNYLSVPGQGPLFRTSNPDVIRVEPDEEDDTYCYLVPVGLGESVISLDSDEYYGPVLLKVTDWNISMTAIHSDPASIGLPAGTVQWGPGILPENTFTGTSLSPYLLPCFTEVTLNMPTLSPIDLWSYDSGNGHFSSSDPEIVEVIQKNCFETYLNPVGPGICTITYQEGPFRKEVVVRSQPDALQQVGCIDPGFYTYYGSAQVRRDAVSLEDGLPIVMAIASEAGSGTREALSSEGFRFSQSGVVRVELYHDNLFSLVPVGDGTTTLTYTTKAGMEFQLHIAVGLPEPVWDFVMPDDAAASGYRIWDGERAAVGDRLEQEVFFALIIPAGDGSIHTAKVLDPPKDLTVEAQDPAAFNLERRGDALYVSGAPQEAGIFTLSISATPSGTSTHTWEKRLAISQPILVTENTVAAINEAIRTAPIADGYETVILLPQGYIPMDGDTPVLLSRPVTLRGQNTTLASDVVALSTVPGAKLQDITIRFDDASTYNGTAGLQNRTKYHFVFPDALEIDKLLFAIYGDGIVTLENCVIDGGSGHNRCQYGIAAVGDGISFQGANTIQNFTQAGWVLYSTPGPRRTFRGLTFTGNEIGVQTIYMGSSDPYFIRLIESNFITNTVNVESDFPVNFSHNYFLGGNDAHNITKSPQYTKQLEFTGNNAAIEYPNLRIEEEHLTSAELLNFEGQAPIDTTNFTAADGPVQIAVKELAEAGVGAEESSNVLLQWSFPQPENVLEEAAVLLRPDAYIDEIFELPTDSGIKAYQGISFAHHGPLPMKGAEISVLKKTLFSEDTLYLYRLADGVLTACGEIDNEPGDFYTFSLDGCSDYIITNVVVKAPGDGDGNEGGSTGGGGSDGGSDGDGTGGGDSNSGSDGDGTGGEDSNSGSDGGSTGGGGGNSGSNGGSTGVDNGKESSEGSSTNGGQNNSRNDETNTSGSEGNIGDGSGNDNDGNLIDSIGNTGVHSNYNYSHIPAPTDAVMGTQKASVNSYVDQAAIQTAFQESQNQQVVIDVGVKTIISPLAFQLLAENPSYTLILKGDGYEWRFSGTEVHSASGFNTAVSWQEDQTEGISKLSFAEQDNLPGNCLLILETERNPKRWASYSRTQKQYIPYTMNIHWLEKNRLAVQMDDLGDYIAIF